MVNIIEESGMFFIAQNVFHIEKADFFTSCNQDIKTVEFVRANGNKLLFIEAKSSFPNPKKQVEGTDEFKSNVDAICEKFVHSLNLYASIAMGVNEQVLSHFNPANRLSITFVVVINNFEQQWCIPIQKAINNILGRSIVISQIWKPTVLVINDRIAIRENLVVEQIK